MANCTVPNQFTVYLVGPPLVLDDPKSDRKTGTLIVNRKHTNETLIISAFLYSYYALFLVLVFLVKVFNYNFGNCLF